MHVRVLGSGAGGGLPQWNCACENCDAARRGEIPRRTQASVAVSSDGESWFLLSASPDILVQIANTPELQPRAERGSPVAGVVLPNGDVDSCVGLFCLRENEPLSVYSTRAVWSGLAEHNVLVRTLQRFEGHLRVHTVGAEPPGCALLRSDQSHSGLSVRAIPVRGKEPLHLEGLVAPSAGHSSGLLVHDQRSERTLAFLPSVGGPSPELEAALREAHLILFDGTFWTSDELSSRGMATRSAEQMGHWPLSGPEGSLAFLRELPGRSMLVHVNNTNPMLRPGPERDALERSGVELAHDGMSL